MPSRSPLRPIFDPAVSYGAVRIGTPVGSNVPETPPDVPPPSPPPVIGWRLLMFEDFDTDVTLGTATTSGSSTAMTAYPNIGVYPTTYYDTSSHLGRPAGTQGQYDANATVSVSGGILTKHLHTVGTRPKVCALLPHLPTSDPAVTVSGLWTYQLYGRYEIVARFPDIIAGYKVAWLTWPISGGNTLNGEIDFPEHDLGQQTETAAFLHHAPSTPSPFQHGSGSIAVDLTDWHTYTTEWSPGFVEFFIDGVSVFSDNDRIPAVPMRWVIQTETQLSSTPPSTGVSGDVEIDSVAVWAYDSTPIAGLTGPTTSTSSGGTLTITTGGTQTSPLIYQDVQFARQVVIQAPWVTFINCEFIGGTPSGRLVDLGHANCVGIRFEQCTFRPTIPNWSCCIGGHDFTLSRCDLSGAVDCVNITGATAANVVIEFCYMHDMYFWSGPAVGQSDNMTHNDCIQMATAGSYNRVRIYGNTLVASMDPTISDYAAPVYSGGDLQSGYPWYGAEPSPGFYGGTASLMFSPQAGTTITNWLVENNSISGGRVGLNMGGFTGTQPTLQVKNNRWGRDWRSGNPASTIIKQSSFHFGALTGNTYEDDGSPFNSGEGAGTFP